MSTQIKITISPGLHALIALRAADQGVTQDTLVDSLLGSEIPRAEALLQQNKSLVNTYLTDPRVVVVTKARTTTRISRVLNERVRALTAGIAHEAARSIPKGRVIQALLWSALEPAPIREHVERPDLLVPGATITVQISRGLNTTLRAIAAQRHISRLTIVTDLLNQATTVVASAPELLSTLPKTNSSSPNTTIHVPRCFDSMLDDVAQQWFSGIKSHALQALIHYALAHGSLPPVEFAERTVVIDGPLSARIAEQLRIQRMQDIQVSFRDYIHQVLEAHVRQKERDTQD